MSKYFEDLCYHDPRNPNFYQIDPDEPVEPRVHCACDNCYYGRDPLALRIIELEEQVETLEQTYYDEEIPPPSRKDDEDVPF